ncbi:MAG: DUF1080 domain-containing protein [Planctomycetota bacterium]|nr:DUF1080 domain-containing protein [Planctomycetota bacterium]
MAQRFAAFVAGVALMGMAWAGTPEMEVQGLYEGAGKDAKGEFKLEVRVVGQGDGKYKVLVRQLLADNTISRVELAGKTAGDAVTFAGSAGDVEWKGVYAAGVIKGEIGAGGTFEIKRVEKKSPALGKKPPEGAVILLGDKGVAEMVRANGADWYLGDMSKQGWPVFEAPVYTISEKDPAEWPSADKPLPTGWVLSKERRRADVVTGVGEDGSIQVPRAGMNSKQQVEGSFDLHVEFINPFQPKDHSQGRGNSGVFLPNGEEIQVLDSFGETTYTGGGCGGFYKYKDPDTMEVIESLKNKPENKFTLASYPPGTWQTYDVEYRVEKKDGKYAGKPRVTVYHNGINIHDKFETNSAARKGGFSFQDHGNPVRFRNIWVLPIEQK